MKKLNMYCLCLHNKHFQTVKKLGYIPVGLGKGFFSPEWLRDNEGENISSSYKSDTNSICSLKYITL